METDDVYVLRRRWTPDEKRAVVDEAATSGSVIGTAKRHGIQAQQIYRWRERLYGAADTSGFAAVTVVADPPMALPAPVPDLGRPDACPAMASTRMDDRIEIDAGGVTVRLPAGSSADLVVAIAAGLSRRRR